MAHCCGLLLGSRVNVAMPYMALGISTLVMSSNIRIHACGAAQRAGASGLWDHYVRSAALAAVQGCGEGDGQRAGDVACCQWGVLHIKVFIAVGCHRWDPQSLYPVVPLC